MRRAKVARSCGWKSCRGDRRFSPVATGGRSSSNWERQTARGCSSRRSGRTSFKGDLIPDEREIGLLCVVSCVDWAGIWADSKRQAPTLARVNDGISCSLPMV